MIVLLSAILALIASVLINVTIDSGGVNNHTRQWFRYKLPISLPAVLLFAWAAGFGIDGWLTSAALCVVWFAVLFNGLYNIGRHKAWFYPGSPGPNDSLMERVQRSMPGWVWIAINVLTAAGSTYLYVKYH